MAEDARPNSSFVRFKAPDKGKLLSSNLLVFLASTSSQHQANGQRPSTLHNSAICYEVERNRSSVRFE